MSNLKLWFHKHLRIIIIVLTIVVVVLVILLIFLGYTVSWTGFNKQQGQPSKTLWDWMQLLIIPIFLTFGVVIINYTQQKRERNITEHRAQVDRDSTIDSQRETVLQAYLDRISQLLQINDLSSTNPDQKILVVVRAQTLTALQRLDPARRGDLFRFLYEAGLVGKFSLNEANFSGANLSGASLGSVSLRQADLSGANLSGVTLRKADLINANLRDANFSRAIISDTLLAGADLTNTNLENSHLVRVGLVKAKYTQEQLDKCASVDTNYSYI
ncbi:MAG: hypothetical protein NVS4B11_20580 [Ktedonobacteraceae bacterium]